MRFSKFVTVVFVLMAFGVVAGCGGGGEQQTAQQTTQTQPSATGSLVATVNFEGTEPEPETFDSSGNSECDVDTVKSDAVIVNDNGTLKNVVVAVKEAPTSLDKSLESPTIDQENCQYKPAVSVVKVGNAITVHDSDQGLHNIRGTLNGRQLFNAQTFKGQSKEITLDKAGAVSLECDVHPWMQAWVYVSENGAAAVTGNEGTASLSDLPTGEYTLEFWHEKYGKQTKTVTIEKDQEASVEVTFSAK